MTKTCLYEKEYTCGTLLFRLNAYSELLYNNLFLAAVVIYCAIFYKRLISVIYLEPYSKLVRLIYITPAR